MFRMASQTLPATAFKSPAIALSGVVDYEMYTKFRTQFDTASDQNIVVIPVTRAGPVSLRHTVSDLEGRGTSSIIASQQPLTGKRMGSRLDRQLAKEAPL